MTATGLLKQSVHFLSTHDNWATPKDVYAALDSEFYFNDDPCPLNGSGGLSRDWGTSTFCNPPYSQIKEWVAYAAEQASGGKRTIVLLIPSRTDTRWWHEYVMKADEIRFIKGRLKFGGSKNSAPFPSCIVVWRAK